MMLQVKIPFLIKSDRASFDGIEKWIKDVQEHRGDDAILAIVGNKLDLTDKRYIFWKIIET